MVVNSDAFEPQLFQKHGEQLCSDDGPMSTFLAENADVEGVAVHVHGQSCEFDEATYIPFERGPVHQLRQDVPHPFLSEADCFIHDYHQLVEQTPQWTGRAYPTGKPTRISLIEELLVR
mgnify:CR=1 FL=1